MRHLTVSDFGVFLGVTGGRLVVRSSDGTIWETALSRLRTIRIEKKGVSMSTDLMLACAARGIRIFILDWRGIGVVAVSGQHQHAVVNVREAQFRAIRSPASFEIAKEMIRAKVRNQRVVLLYFGKYLSKTSPEKAALVKNAADVMEGIADVLKQWRLKPSELDWRSRLMGLEGSAAQVYWKTLRDVGLLASSFVLREGRGSAEVTNAALNYGYAILQSYVWSALDNAGFELYAGFLHAQNPGKPSLVLDVMEEYRAWVVDRNVIKLRSKLETAEGGLTRKLKEAIDSSIAETMTSTVIWRGRKVSLENALQRQVYRLAGVVVEGKSYKSIRFKW